MQIIRRKHDTSNTHVRGVRGARVGARALHCRLVHRGEVVRVTHHYL